MFCRYPFGPCDGVKVELQRGQVLASADYVYDDFQKACALATPSFQLSWRFFSLPMARIHHGNMLLWATWEAGVQRFEQAAELCKRQPHTLKRSFMYVMSCVQSSMQISRLKCIHNASLTDILEPFVHAMGWNT